MKKDIYDMFSDMDESNSKNNPKNHKKGAVITLILLAILLPSLGINIYQYQEKNQLATTVDSLTDEKNRLASEVILLISEKNQVETTLNSKVNEGHLLAIRVSNLNNRTDMIDSKIKEFFYFQGELCEDPVESCLDKYITKSKMVSDIECASISDGVCPRWCDADSDYDCCINAGNNWIFGVGCYS